MKTSPQFLTLFSAFLCFLTIDAIVVKQENSLYGPYEAGAGYLQHWDLTGSSQLAETTIRLTPDEPGKQGAIWCNYPMTSNDWEYHIQFHIHGKGVHLNGDGIAFWYVRDPLHSGPVFGSKDHWSGLGIFVDTFENAATPHNHFHPYLSAVVNNGTFHYHHNEQGTAGQVGGCHLQARNLEWPAKVAISYISDVLTVYVDTQGTDNWMQCFRAVGVYLPTGYSFGVSASTSEYSDNHDVVSITTLDNIVPDRVWEDRSELLPHAELLEIPFVPYHHQQQQQQFVHEEQFQRVEHEVHHQVIADIKIELPQEVIAEYDTDLKIEPAQQIVVELHPHIKVEPRHHANVDHQPHVKVEPQHHVNVEPQPHVRVEQHPHVEPQPHVKVEQHPHVEPQPHVKVEQPPHVEPQPPVKVEPHAHAEQVPFFNVETQHQFEHQPPKKESQPQPNDEEGPKIEPVETSVSMLKKLLYIAGIGILLYVGIVMFRKYLTQRRERMQKRLY